MADGRKWTQTRICHPGRWSKEYKSPKAEMLSVSLEKHKRAHGTTEEKIRQVGKKQLESESVMEAGSGSPRDKETRHNGI